jgi:hypothetical protein
MAPASEPLTRVFQSLDVRERSPRVEFSQAITPACEGTHGQACSVPRALDIDLSHPSLSLWKP